MRTLKRRPAESDTKCTCRVRKRVERTQLCKCSIPKGSNDPNIPELGPKCYTFNGCWDLTITIIYGHLDPQGLASTPDASGVLPMRPQAEPELAASTWSWSAISQQFLCHPSVHAKKVHRSLKWSWQSSESNVCRFQGSSLTLNTYTRHFAYERQDWIPLFRKPSSNDTSAFTRSSPRCSMSATACA